MMTPSSPPGPKCAEAIAKSTPPSDTSQRSDRLSASRVRVAALMSRCRIVPWKDSAMRASSIGCSCSVSFNRTSTNARPSAPRRASAKRTNDLGRFATGRERGQRRDAEQTAQTGTKSGNLRPPIQLTRSRHTGKRRAGTSQSGRSCIAVRGQPNASSDSTEQSNAAPKDDVSIMHTWETRTQRRLVDQSDR